MSFVQDQFILTRIIWAVLYRIIGGFQCIDNALPCPVLCNVAGVVKLDGFLLYLNLLTFVVWLGVGVVRRDGFCCI